MKHDIRPATEYPNLIEAEALGGTLVSYIRIDALDPFLDNLKDFLDSKGFEVSKLLTKLEFPKELS